MPTVDAGGRKVRATTPEQTARLIVDAIVAGSFRSVIGSDARMLDRLNRLTPTRAAKIVSAPMKVSPRVLTDAISSAAPIDVDG